MDIQVNTETNELIFSDNDLQTVTGAEAIGQDIALAVKTIQGEWFRDTNEGVDWFKIWDKRTTQRTIEAILRRRIQRRPGVESVNITRYEVDASTRAGTITVQVRTVEGNANYTVPIGG